MQLLKPTKFPHVPPYAYTRQGFDRRVRKRLRRDGFTVSEVRKLRQLYFSDGSSPHQDERGVFCDDYGNVTGFSSPRTIVRIGAMPFFT